jgi:hypothetical protein
MSHYYLSLLVLAVAGLVVTSLSGILHWTWHLSAALPTAMAVVALHSLTILFALIGSRLLREAANNCGLSPEFLTRSNSYFRQPSGLFLSLGGAFSIVAAGVLGYGHRAFQLPPWVHLSGGLAAALVTCVSVPFELRTLHSIERLLDATRLTLAEEDRQRAARGLGPVDEGVVPRRDTRAQTALFVAIAPWCVYLYQALVVWQGRFERVSVHPWVELSALGLLIWATVPRKARASREPGQGR